jgi:CRP-like cAMP-binding protein
MADHRELHRAATNFLQAGQPARAVEVLLTALRTSPDDLTLRALLGDLYSHLGHAEAAVACYRAVAGAHASKGNLVAAIAACRSILRVDPNHSATQKLLADLFTRSSSSPTQVKVPAPIPSAPRGMPPPQLSPVPRQINPSDFKNAAAPRARPSAPPPPAPSAPAPLHWSWDGGSAGEDEPLQTITGVELPETHAHDLAEVAVNPGNLPHVPLFSDLSKSAFVWLLQRLELHKVGAGDVIANEGDFGDSLFIVVAGKVRIEKKREGGPPAVVGVLGPNTFFGEIALLGSGVRTATAIADTDADLLELTRDTLDELVEQHPSVKNVMRRFYRERLFADLTRTSLLFRNVKPEQMRELVARFKELESERGTRLQIEGKKTSGLHVILDGRCEVTRVIDGRKTTVNELGAGDVFGGTSFLTGEPAVTTVTARVKTTTLVLPHSAAPELLSRHPQVREILKLVADGGEKVMDSAVAAAPKRSGKTGKHSTAALKQLQGDLSTLKPPSLLVFFEMERMTGVLKLDGPAGQASLFLNAGRIFDVEAPGPVPDPMARLSEILTWDQGTFAFTIQLVEREDRIKTGTTGLLLEAARVADEAAGGGGGDGELDFGEG